MLFQISRKPTELKPCNTCLFYVQDGYTVTGECHANPPKVVVANSQPITRYPTVIGTEPGCGEYIEKVEVTKAKPRSGTGREYV